MVAHGAMTVSACVQYHKQAYFDAAKIGSRESDYRRRTESILRWRKTIVVYASVQPSLITPEVRSF